jgi:hypothetical protein
MKKILTGLAVFVTGAACGLIFAYGPLYAQSSVDGGSVMSKLNEIFRGQAQMMAVLNSMKEDVSIIKIRITQMQ